MKIESRQFALVLVTGTSAFQTIATVPADVRWIVKDMRLRSYFAGAPTQYAIAGENPGGVFAPLHDTGMSAATDHWQGWSVLESGDLLRVYVTTGDYLRVLASGTELSDY